MVPGQRMLLGFCVAQFRSLLAGCGSDTEVGGDVHICS